MLFLTWKRQEGKDFHVISLRLQKQGFRFSEDSGNDDISNSGPQLKTDLVSF